MKFDYQRDYEERVALFHRFIPQTGIAVLDGSLYSLGSDHLACWYDYDDIKKTIEAERTFVRYLHGFFKAHTQFVFPPEVFNELDDLNTMYCTIARKDPRLHQLLAGLRRDTKSLLLSMTPLADHLPHDISPWLDTLKRTVLKASLEFYATDPYLRYKRRQKDARGWIFDHTSNDEAIVAQCLALSYGQRVRLVSADYDFTHIYEATYESLEDLTAHGLPYLPPYPIELIFVNQKRESQIILPRRRIRRLAHMA